MTESEARNIVAEEMDYWRAWMLKKVQETRGRDALLTEEVITCAILGSASAQLRQSHEH